MKRFACIDFSCSTVFKSLGSVLKIRLFYAHQGCIDLIHNDAEKYSKTNEYCKILLPFKTTLLFEYNL